VPGPYIVVNDLLDAIAQGLKKGDRANLKAYWTPIAGRCVERGWRDVSNLLRGRGYTDAQLDGWDDRVSYNLDQSLFWAYIEGGGPAEQSERDVKELDHRKQLADDSFALRISGVMVAPGGTTDDGAGGVGSGTLPVTSDGTDYGTTFGLRVNRLGGVNQYGDDVFPANRPGTDFG
jgi:hypothetical protein